MAYIGNDLVRALCAIKEIEEYLNQKIPRVGDASYTCTVALSSFENSEGLEKATKRAQNR